MPDTAVAPVELIRSLAVLIEAPEAGAGPLAEALGLPSVPTASEYSDVFLFQLYPYASVHLGPEGMMGGEARDRVSGFWRALGLTPPAEPDHLAALLGLYASLADRESELPPAEVALSRQTRRALLEEHLAPWAFAFLDRCVELAPPAYARWAALLRDVLREEWGAEVPDKLPLHLRDAPALPDPRDGGADDFVGGLLAPLRSGMIVTRADLAAIAGRTALGLRAGERRYALEHLLAQDPRPVLLALAAEADRQRAGHAGRVSWLGSSSLFFGERCERTRSLLEALAAE